MTETEQNRQFVDALRGFLRLAPLYTSDESEYRIEQSDPILARTVLEWRSYDDSEDDAREEKKGNAAKPRVYRAKIKVKS